MGRAVVGLLLCIGLSCQSLAAALSTATGSSAYVVKALSDRLGFGVVEGFDLRNVLSDDALKAQVQRDIKQHRLLVFRGQEQLGGEEHVALSECFGTLDHGLHRPHPKAPHPYLLRVSNDAEEGFRSIGISGWHVDGVMIKWPFHVQTMHFLKATTQGTTKFLGFEELLQSLDEATRETWERRWFVAGVGDDLMNGDGQVALHPLVTSLDENRRGMCMHLGAGYCLGIVQEDPQRPEAGSVDAKAGDDADEPQKVEKPKGFFDSLFAASAVPASAARALKSDNVFDAEEELARLLACDRTEIETPGEVLGELRDRIDEASSDCIFEQSWQDGDFAFIDNRALAHLPSAGTQNASDQDGLRLFHRTTMTDGSPLVSRRRQRPSLVISAGSVPLPGGSGGVDIKDPYVYRRVLRGLVEKQSKSAA